MIMNQEYDNCTVCGKLTNFMDSNSKEYFCSEECLDIFYFSKLVSEKLGVELVDIECVRELGNGKSVG